MKVMKADSEYRESMLGPDILAGASNRWWELVTFFSLEKISLQEWEAMSNRDKGELIAFKRLSSMQEIVERHVMEQSRRKREKEREKANKWGRKSSSASHSRAL